MCTCGIEYLHMYLMHIQAEYVTHLGEEERILGLCRGHWRETRTSLGVVGLLVYNVSWIPSMPCQNQCTISINHPLPSSDISSTDTDRPRHQPPQLPVLSPCPRT
ncbi:hypothetical protein PILCRDRAFT_278359 [Piloderma croceum F 1598]|uniref:Uncharacterized protein n=1 Tax=Piloderma croceum (strain F 1598) TaxID=765440 RepID=A0A0C3G6N8_PILCF|nr:hypothetical protein PILCRDRAFT_278359 [Piloderma croceum F 1598]